MSELQSWVGGMARRQASLAGSGPTWLGNLRKQALARFVDEGWPTARQEAWRHTSLAALAQQTFSLPDDAAASSPLQRPYTDADEGHWMVFVDGVYAPGLSRVGALPAGVALQPLSDVVASGPDRLEGLMGSESDGATPVALNLALAADGAFIHVPRGVALEDPVHLVFIATGRGLASFPRNLVQAEADSQAVIMEHFLGQGDGASHTNSVTRLALEADAHVTHLKLQHEDTSAFHLGATDVTLQKGSVFTSHSMSFGAQLARHDISADFRGMHGELLLNGLYYVNGRRHVDHQTVIRHSEPACVSREYYRGVLDDTSRGVFGGRIFVAPGADKTDAVQRSDSLLLSRLAKADARPELEIYADDVKCAHGATVGQIDADSLFYLRSRGLDEAHARHVLTYAFAAQAVNRIEPEPLRRRVIGAIRALAPRGAELGDFS